MKRTIALVMIFLIVTLPFTLAQNESTSLNVGIPTYVTSRSIDITGTTSPYTQVTLYINGEVSRINDADFVGEAGRVGFYNVALPADVNQVRVVSGGAEVSGTITVDSSKPTLTISGIPAISFSTEVNFSGTASEQGILGISYLYSPGVDTEAPPGVSGLIVDELNEGSVKLRWNETNITDFHRYVIWREDVGALAAVNSKGTTFYVDNGVTSGQIYVYRISIIDDASNEGPRSNPVNAGPVPGNSTSPQPEPIEVGEITTWEGIETLNVSGTFTGKVTLGEGDGNYDLRFVLTDVAGNTDIYETSVIIDTTPPEIEITSPRRGDSVFENFADQVTIIGVTEPNAKVYLFIGRSPFGGVDLNGSVDVGGLSERLETIPESQLVSQCSTTFGGRRQCSSGADYETTADANGNFRFKDVDLTAIAALGLNVQEVDPGQFDEFIRDGTETYRDLQRRRFDSVRVDMLFIATDQSGQRGLERSHINVGSCWSGSFKFDAYPIVELQQPTFLSPERISEGTEIIQFAFNFSYTGIGDASDITITNAQIRSACDDITRNHPLTNLSCDLISGCTLRPLEPGSFTYYGNCRLKRFDNLTRWVREDWETFFEGIRGGEMLFPFKITVHYTETVPYDELPYDYGDDSDYDDYSGRSTRIPGTQTFCQVLAYAIDDTAMSPQDYLPDWMLEDAVEWLNESINFLNDAEEFLDDVLEIVGIACLSSIILSFVTKVYRRWSCSFEDTLKELEKLGLNSDRENDCSDCLRSSALDRAKLNSQFGGDWREFDREEMSDTCLKICYPSCASGWKAEATVYSGHRWSCDRFFGHPAPSKWTEEKKDQDLIKRATTLSEGCASDGGVSGVPLKRHKCQTLAPRFNIPQNVFPDRNKDCLEGFASNNQRVMYELGNRVLSNSNNRDDTVYNINIPTGGPWRIRTTYAIKHDDDNFITAKSKSCKDICSEKNKDSSEVRTDRVEVTANGKIVPAGTSTSQNRPKWEGHCLVASVCDALPSKDKTLFAGGTIPNFIQTSREGYTTDCFFPEHNVMADSKKREECCCINTDYFEEEGDVYYTPSDVEHKDHVGEQPIQTAGNEYKDMQFSYRYHKNGWEAPSEATEYNPFRYIEGRDLSACFGQNNWLFDDLLGNESIIVLDPAKQHTSAFQCLALSQIRARLSELKQMMMALQGCLLTIRITGTADAGVCKELFTSYVCSTMWRVINAFRDECSPISLVSANEDLGIGETFEKGLDGILDSVADTQTQLSDEYNNAALNNFLGVGEEAFMRKVCLAAFGYDWELSMENFMDVAYTTPTATNIVPLTATREYLGYNPRSAKSRYEYRGSWTIYPGCDMSSYQVLLTCVTRDELTKPGVDCGTQNDPMGSNCDCLNNKEVPDRQLPRDTGGTPRLRQGQLVTEARHDIREEVQRYDHIKFVLRTDREITGDLRASCFGEGNEDGVYYTPITDRTANDILDCRIDASTGVFTCDQGTAFLGTKGTATIQGIEVRSGNNVIPRDLVDRGSIIDGLFFNEDLWVKPYVNRGIGPDQCLRMRLKDGSGRIENELSRGITVQGPANYDFFELSTSMTMGEGTSILVTPNNFQLSVESGGGVLTSGTQTARITLTDGNNNGFKFGEASDKVDVVNEFGQPLTQVSADAYNNGRLRLGVIFNALVDMVPYREDESVAVTSYTARVETSQNIRNTKTIELKLFHLKDISEGVFVTPDDCDYTDPIQGGVKNYRIRLEQRPTDDCVDERKAGSDGCVCEETWGVYCRYNQYCLNRQAGQDAICSYQWNQTR
ncbi:hypothetical protein ACFLZX_03395 [Nanoarchaeota archaeon]